MHIPQYTAVLTFWFDELTATDRFSGDATIDQVITDRFKDVHTNAIQNELWQWRAHPEGALAEIIVLDQFSRNIYRGEGRAFAADPQALTLAQAAVATGFAKLLSAEEQLFVYLPYMHSESALIHEVAEELFTALGNEEALLFEKKHKAIIDQFGRYPHRNRQLGRESTPAEQQYLASTQEAFFNS